MSAKELYSHIDPKLKKKMSNHERQWAAKFNSASAGYREQLRDLNIPEPELTNTIQELGQESHRRRRDVMSTQPLTAFLADVHYEVSASENFEDIMIDLIDSQGTKRKPVLRAVEVPRIDVGSKVIVRVPGHLYHEQSGSVLSTRRNEFLVQIETKKVPVRTKSCNRNAPALVWLNRDDLKLLKSR